MERWPRGLHLEGQQAAFFNVYSTTRMIRIVGTIFAGLLGLAFGSFLNVCLSRWPEGESVVRPRSHCRDCDHALAWWENLPLLSWLALRGRCRKCGAWIGLRYPLVELAIGVLWAWIASGAYPDVPGDFVPSQLLVYVFALRILQMFLMWLLVAMAVLDAEHFWLPNFLTIPGTAIGLASATLDPFILVKLDPLTGLPLTEGMDGMRFGLWTPGIIRLGGILIAAGLMLLIRWLYKLIRKREGMGLGDVKLMAMLAAWLGLPGALLAFGLGAVLGAFAALVLLAVPARDSESGAATKLPFGTFLCIGGIVSSLWGEQMIAAYLHWAGL
jgi:leader peptidase (prepilin peptidase)/N-methyltransferase